VGIIERDGGTLYCTAILIDRDGKHLSTHRKLIPTAAERLVWGQGAGDGLRVVDTELGRVGGLICWENYMPAARLALYQQGIEYEIGTLFATVIHKLTSFQDLYCSKRG
jgi:nitrilase